MRKGGGIIIDYSPLWLMKEKHVSQYGLLKSGIDNKTLDRLKKNNNITLLTLEKLCKILDCTPNDVENSQKQTAESPETFEKYFLQSVFLFCSVFYSILTLRFCHWIINPIRTVIFSSPGFVINVPDRHIKKAGIEIPACVLIPY